MDKEIKKDRKRPPDSAETDQPETEKSEQDEGTSQLEKDEGNAVDNEEKLAESPEEQLAEMKDKLLRALAENENLIRRARREREDASKYAATNFARDMLSVADNLSRALDCVPETDSEPDGTVIALLEGVKLTERELNSVLERNGVVRFSPAGEKFDHQKHEALFEVPTDEGEPGMIMQVFTWKKSL